MNQLAVIDHNAATLTAVQVKGHVQLIQQVMESVMKEGVHYGTIPGTDKPSLLKPGAEVLMTTFRIAVDPQTEDLSTSDEIRYRIRCIGTHQTSGVLLGAGIGECSSSEEKYKWRRSVCDEEFDQTPEERRRLKFVKVRGKNGNADKVYQNKQIRTEPSDVANTVLKMAKKRALVDFTLTALAASDCFNQDLEEMDETLRESLTEGEPKNKVQQPRAKAAEPKAEKQDVDPNKKVNEKQVGIIQKTLERSGIPAEDFCKHFGIQSLPELPFGKINDALKYAAGPE